MKKFNYITESSEELVNSILDKINKKGKFSLSYDERRYLNMYKDGNIDKELENWLLYGDNTDIDGNLILFDEFEVDEKDILFNDEKVIRILKKKFGKSVGGTAEWADGFVFPLGGNNFLIYTDNLELEIVNRIYNEELDEYDYKVIYKAEDNYYSFYKALNVASKLKSN